jgi:hypothetical protein
MATKAKAKVPVKKRPPGRVSTYTKERGALICERLAKGETLASICREAGMPGYSTVHDWIAAHKEFAGCIAQARARGFDVIAEDCLAIADETSRDTIYTEQGERPDSEWIARSKLRVDTRLKLLAKWDPKRYGDLTKVEHSGSVDIAASLTAARARSGLK